MLKTYIFPPQIKKQTKKKFLSFIAVKTNINIISSLFLFFLFWWKIFKVFFLVKFNIVNQLN